MSRNIINALFFVLFFITCSVGREDNSETPSQETTEIKVENEQTTLECLRAGDGDTTLLFIHGWCINRDYWSQQIDFFKPNYQVIAPDLPGFGKSVTHRKENTMETYGEDLAQLIDELELKNVILIGHSMGGNIMLEVALKRPNAIIGLVGVDNFKNVGQEISVEERQEITEFLDMLEQNFSSMAPAYAETMLFHPATDSTITTRVKEDFAKANSVVAISSLNSLWQSTEKEVEQLHQLPWKLNLINCSEPPTQTSSLESACPNGFEVYSISNSGHFPMLEQPEIFNRHLQGIIRSIEKPISI